MKTNKIFLIIFATATILSNCAYQNPNASHTARDATTGALLGGAVGGIIGHQSKEGAAGAALGAGLGGLFGGYIGQKKDRQESQYGYGAPAPYHPRSNYQNGYGNSY
jgi:hypothetical protein